MGYITVDDIKKKYEIGDLKIAQIIFWTTIPLYDSNEMEIEFFDEIDIEDAEGKVDRYEVKIDRKLGLLKMFNCSSHYLDILRIKDQQLSKHDPSEAHYDFSRIKQDFKKFVRQSKIDLQIVKQILYDADEFYYAVKKIFPNVVLKNDTQSEQLTNVAIFLDTTDNILSKDTEETKELAVIQEKGKKMTTPEKKKRGEAAHNATREKWKKIFDEEEKWWSVATEAAKAKYNSQKE